MSITSVEIPDATRPVTGNLARRSMTTGLDVDKQKLANLESTFEIAKRDPDLLPQQVAIELAEATGAAMAFRWVSILPMALVFIFGAITLGQGARGLQN